MSQLNCYFLYSIVRLFYSAEFFDQPVCELHTKLNISQQLITAYLFIRYCINEKRKSYFVKQCNKIVEHGICKVVLDNVIMSPTDNCN